MRSGLLLLSVLACVYSAVSMQALSKTCARFTGKIPRSAREKGFQLSTSSGDVFNTVGAFSSAIVAAYPGVSRAWKSLRGIFRPLNIISKYLKIILADQHSRARFRRYTTQERKVMRIPL